MKKLLMVLLAMVLGLVVSGCGAGLVVNVDSITDQYKQKVTNEEPIITAKCNYYPTEPSYKELRKRMIWNAKSITWVAGALIITDNNSFLLTQREDLSITTIFKIGHNTVEDVYIEKYSNTAGLTISTSEKTYVLEIAKGMMVDKQKTYDIYNLLLSKTLNKNNRKPMDLEQEKKIEEEKNKPTPVQRGGDTGWGG